ncbi:MAG: glycine cleavage system protein GcvH [Gammaproteobacteria bacterium]|nr:glycine cleavage system protein GcvH [Gammaproteobacteria bacterium]
MKTLKFTEDHEWLAVGDDNTITVGITDYAQRQLGDIVYVELPQVGQAVTAGDEIVVIESVKAAGDIKSPCAGTVTAINDRLAGAPEVVNQDPLGDGWLFRMRVPDPAALNGLMDENAYAAFVEGL